MAPQGFLLDSSSAGEHVAAAWRELAACLTAAIFGSACLLACLTLARADEPPPLQTTPTTPADYWVILFSYQDATNRPHNSHTFAEFVATTPNRQVIERCHISWMPARGGVRLFAEPVRGVVRTLAQDLQAGQAHGLRLSAWGPLPIDAELFERARQRRAQLAAAEQSGDILYKAADGPTRRLAVHPAINCVHAVSDIAGELITGVRRGDEATAAVVAHFAPYVLTDVRTADWLRSQLSFDAAKIEWRTLPAESVVQSAPGK